MTTDYWAGFWSFLILGVSIVLISLPGLLGRNK